MIGPAGFPDGGHAWEEISPDDELSTLVFMLVKRFIAAHGSLNTIKYICRNCNILAPEEGPMPIDGSCAEVCARHVHDS
jgi:hypothetical protein